MLASCATSSRRSPGVRAASRREAKRCRIETLAAGAEKIAQSMVVRSVHHLPVGSAC